MFQNGMQFRKPQIVVKLANGAAKENTRNEYAAGKMRFLHSIVGAL